MQIMMLMMVNRLCVAQRTLLCLSNSSLQVASLTRVRHVASKNEADLKRAVHNAGPVIWIIIIILLLI